MSCRYAFASGAADNVKKFKLPKGDFLHNFLQQPKVSRPRQAQELWTGTSLPACLPA